MLNEQDRKIMLTLNKITNKILDQVVQENEINLEKYLKPKKLETLNEIYERALQSTCNKQGMEKNIKFNSERKPKFKELLFDFCPKKIVENYGGNPFEGWKPIFYKFQQTWGNESKMDINNKKNQWVQFSKSAIESALFFAKFENKNQFDFFVGRFQTNNENNEYLLEALPLLLQKEIFGFGFALACDFLKEAGFDKYPKPDVHLIDVFTQTGLYKNRDDYEVFKKTIELANLVQEPAYSVDKKIWLVCSGNFYLDNKKVNSNKKELIKQVKQEA